MLARENLFLAQSLRPRTWREQKQCLLFFIKETVETFVYKKKADWEGIQPAL